MREAEDAAVVRVAAKRYWRAEDARVAVEAWRRSGETCSGFALRHGIHPRRLMRWRQNLEAAKPSESDGSIRFYPMRVTPHGNRGPGRAGDEAIEIVLAEGSRVRVPPGFAAEDLERVLVVLGAGAW
jgi:transposase-like protein